MDREEFDKFLEEELQEMSEKIAKGINPLTDENIDDTDDSDNADGGFGVRERILVKKKSVEEKSVKETKKQKFGIDDLDSEPVQAEIGVSLSEDDFKDLGADLDKDKGFGL